MKRFPAMLFSLAVAVTVLASPPPLAIARQLPKGAVFLVLGPGEATAAVRMDSPSVASDPPPEAFLGGLLGQLAVVKPHRSGPDRPPSLQMFVLIAPMRGRVGLHAVGSF